MTEKPSAGRHEAPLWAGTVSILSNHYYGANIGVAVRATSAHVAACRAVAQVRAKLPSRSRVKGFILKLERQLAPVAAKPGTQS
jgi:hypothetical protein